jgi:hypothetical protein
MSGNLSMSVLVDFDGTCTTHDFPNVGKDIGAVPVLKKLVENGHKLILFTMRSHRPFLSFTGNARDTLDEAVDWFTQNDIPLYGINTNPDQKTWTDSPKAFGELLIDDIALGCPLINDREIHQRPFVDWGQIEEMLMARGIIK